MKKSVKGIIGLCSALVVLGGGLAALKLTEPDIEESSEMLSEVSGAGITLINDEIISKVDVENESGNFSVVAQTNTDDDSVVSYTIEGYDDVPLTTSMVGTIPNNARGLVSSAIVAEDCTDTEKYGFDSPQASAELFFESGSSIKILIGDATPTSSQTYFMIDGEKTVYTVETSKIANYKSEVNDFISSTILKEPDEENYPKIENLRVQRDDLDYDIYLEYDEKSDDSNYIGGTSATLVMVEPTFSYLAVERSTPITNGLFGLASNGIYSVHPTESDIAGAGLNEPFCTVTMNCADDNDYVFLMSEPFTDDSGSKSHYAMFEGGNIIYIVSAENAKWGSFRPIDIASKIFLGDYVWNITELTLKCKDVEEYKFEIENNEPGDSSEASSADSSSYNVTKNGEEFDSERYRKYYALLVNASAEDFALNEAVPSTEPLLSLEYLDSYSNKTVKVEFYEASALNALIVIDGESKYYCSKSYVETMVENAKRIETGEDYLTTWK